MIEKEINDAERKRCKFCGKLFTPKLSWQTFCEPAHQKAYWKQVQNDKLFLLKKIEKLEEKFKE